ncbi:MAG: hypothetical protein R2850_01215 [Bacteroidia bacterium]
MPSYDISSDEKGLFDGAGQLHKLKNPYSNQFFVSSFSPAGALEWMLSGSEFVRDSRLLNICARPDGNVIVAFTSSGIDQYPLSFCDELGEIEGFGQGEPVPHKTDSIFENRNRRSEIQYTYLAEFDKSGRLKGYHAFRLKEYDTWFSFECAPNGTMYFTTTDSYHVIENGKGFSRGGNILVRISSDFKSVNRKIFEYITPSCCSHMEPGMVCTVSERGELFVGGTYHTGVKVEGAKDHMVKRGAGYTGKQYYNSYVAKLDPENLKLNWIRHSDGWTHIKAITVSDQGIYIGGRVQFDNTSYKQKLDTTDSKAAFLMCMNLSGEALWTKTFNAMEVNALCHDFAGNIYTLYCSKRARDWLPLKLAATPFRHLRTHCYSSLRRKRNYKWSKKAMP